MSVGPTYSDRYGPQEEKDDTMEEDISAEYHNQQVKRDRVKRLSAETNRRRKALELKKRLEAQKELKRRSEVLEERRRKQQEATQRYQRLNRTTPKKSPSRQDSHHRTYGINFDTGPRLHEGIPMAKGYKMVTTPYRQPAVDDVLKMVGHQSNQSPGGYHQNPLMTASPRDRQHEYITAERDWPYQNTGPAVDGNADGVTREPDPAYHHKYHGYTTTATLTNDEHQNSGSDNFTAAESQPVAPSIQQSNGMDIHRELAEQQRVFIEQQRKSLMEFNRALLEESSRKNFDLDCSSVSSVDSLEEARKHPPGKLDYRESREGDPHPLGNRPVQPSRTVEGAGQRSVPQGHSVNNLSNNSRSHQLRESFVWNGSQCYEQDSPVKATVDYGRIPPTQERHQSGENDKRQYEGHKQFERGIRPTSKQPPASVHSDNNDGRNVTTQQGSNSANQVGAGSGSIQQQGGNAQRRQYQTWDQNGRRTDNVLTLKVDPPQVGVHRNSPKQQEGGKPRKFPTRTAATPVYTVMPNQDPVSVANGDRSHGAMGQEVNQGNANLEDERVPPVSGDFQHQEYFRDDGSSNHQVGGSPKSILRKFSKYSGNEQTVGQKWGQRDLRDSVEIASTTHMRRTASGKSVRWTDMAYADSDPGYASEKDVRGGSQDGGQRPHERSKSPVINARLVQQKLTASAEMDKQSIRGQTNSSKTTFRAKFASPNVLSTDVQSRDTRGYPGRGYAAPAGKPPTGKSNGDPVKSTSKRVNGMTLNKTPTDEEINQLWDKVRTCLHSREGTPDLQSLAPPAGIMRRVSSDQSLAESGARLTANLRVAPPPSKLTLQGPDQAKQPKKYHTVPRWRTNSDSGTAVARRASASLLQRTPDRTGKQQVGGADGRNRAGPPPAPVSSQTTPHRTAVRAQQMANEVDDSLLAFQQAERLAHQNFSEAEIEAALNRQNNQQNGKMPSALSMEEQRILESLDRLNEKLRITSDVSTNYAAMTPRPPAHGPGPSFRGHRPASFKQYGTNSPGRPGLRVRSSSAEREGARIWTYR